MELVKLTDWMHTEVINWDNLDSFHGLSSKTKKPVAF